ncbi:MAG: 4Fe-4S binding protein [bacterium]|nr:4Fe-4S binding protein [bacterium]
MRLGRSWVVAALGFFAVLAQTVLFRAFLTAFEGNELGIGAFFASWLAWVAIGAALGRTRWLAGPTMVRRFSFLTLLYLPAMLLQLWLAHDIRALAGVAGYERFPLLPMLCWSFVVNAPVSLVTGYLFTMACRWGALDSTGRLTPGRVYVRETLGACAGGVAVTALLVAGAPGETVVLVGGTVVSTGAAVTAWVERRRGKWLWVLPAGLAAALIAAAALGAGGRWAEVRRQAVWERVLPRDAYSGTFTTAQAEYLYGERDGQFLVLSSGGVCEALPNTEHASETVAVTLAQAHRARRVLVVGPGSLGVCLRFRELPQIEQVVWQHPDPEYARHVMGLLPETLRDAAMAIDVPAMDVRAFLRGTDARFDLVVLNLPDATTLVVNRYSTREFYESIRARLSETGIVGVRVTGAANFLGPELAALGASAAQTLGSVFGAVAVKPGDETWLIASDRAAITEDGAELARRWADIEGGANVFPPEAVTALYPPDRVAFQREAYAAAARELGPAAVNTDRHPRALQHALLASLRREGTWSVSLAGLRSLGPTGAWWLFVAPLLVYGLLRLVYVYRHGARDADDASGAAPVFDAKMLVLLTGTASMALTIVLLFFYQAAFGSLFLYVGLATALFMAGALAGSVGSGMLAERWANAASTGLMMCLVAHLVLLAVVGGLPVDAVFGTYVVLFALCGVFTGVYFPLAAARLGTSGIDAGRAGASLELLDHAGGTLGAAVTGLIWLPLLSGPATVSIVATLVAVNLVAVALCRAMAMRGDALGAPRRPDDWFDRWQPALGYVLVGAGAWCMLGYHVAERSEALDRPAMFAEAAQAMAGDLGLIEESGAAADGTSYPRYATAQGGLVLDTGPLVSGVYGYGGPLELAVHIEDGRLRGVRILASNETPSYLDYVQPWLDWLESAELRVPEELAQVDALSGATLTCDAVRDTVIQAASKAGLGAAGDAGTPRKRDSAAVAFIRLAALLVAALAMRQHPVRWVRRVFLVVVVVVAGVWLNTQYSVQNVAALLAGQLPGTGLGASLFLLVVVPVGALLLGNVYCGYLCPFGAVQELLGDLAPKWLTREPPKVLWRFGRAVKYGVLLVLLGAFALTRDATVLTPDPLITFFGSARTTAAVAIAVAVFVLSLVYGRFWCRNLCPAGAFLALLNGLRLVKRLSPTILPVRCDLGVQTGRELDCIRCDRCRMEGVEARRGPEPGMLGALADRGNGVFVVAVLTLAAVIVAMTVTETRAALEPQVVVRAVETTGGVGGEPRDVDAERIQRLIDEGRLSGHEAEYYRVAPEGGPAPDEGRQKRRRRRGGPGR